MDAEQSSVTPTYPPVPDTAKGQAEYYHTNERNIVRYRAKAAPLKDPVKFREWIQGQASAPQGLLDRLEDLLGSDMARIPGQSDPDWAEFEAQLRNEDPKVGMERIEKACAWVSFKFQKASQANQRNDEKHYAKLVATLESVKHDALLRAKKLGIDSGELIKREDVEKWAQSLGFWLLRGADAVLGETTPRLITAAAQGKLDRDAALQILEPAAIAELVVTPLTRSTTTTANNAAPDWLAAAVTRGIESVVELTP